MRRTIRCDLGTLRGLLYPLAALIGGCVFAGGEGEQVVVVYNSRLRQSREVAFYYAARREIPTNQVFGFELPESETVTRTEFRDRLQKPLLKAIERQRLFVVSTDIRPVGRRETGEVLQKVTAARIRYAVLCYGVPVSISRDTTLSEPGMDKTPETMRGNEAAVDSELSLLPAYWQTPHLFGALANPARNATNAAFINPTNGVLMVARLDGPTAEIARGLVDKAMEAETNGLWGRAYFDLRGLTNTNYKLGDDWILGAANVIRRIGFETIVDARPETFPVSFPMSQIAFYAGWYDGNVSGPFARPRVEFMPGAIAYHLHSFSAHSIRTTNQYWVGPLLAAGATATMGYVFEPYLEGTVDLATFFDRVTLGGFSFGEAAYAAQGSLSWQTTVVGDPLYRPFGRSKAGAPIGSRLQELHFQLLERRHRNIEWSHLQVVNLNLVSGYPVSDMITYLNEEPTTRLSAVLQEKLAALYDSQGRVPEEIDAYEKALKLQPTPQQRIRIELALATVLESSGRTEKALAACQRLLDEAPDYPDVIGVWRKMLPLARKLHRDSDVTRIQSELDRLAPPPK